MRSQILSFLAFSLICGQSSAIDKFCEKALQDNAFQTIASNRFITARGLRSYLHSFGPEFAEKLAKLGPEDVWFDGGSGESIAVREYLGGKDVSENESASLFGSEFARKKYAALQKVSRGRKANAFVVTYTSQYKPKRGAFNGKLSFKQGYFEELAPEALPRISVATDFFGIFMYSPSPEAYVRRISERLTTDGNFYVYLGEYYKGPDDSWIGKTNTVKTPDGDMSLVIWLQKHTNLNIDFISSDSDFSRDLVMRIRRPPKQQPIRIPNLRMISTSPRTFILDDSQ